VERPGSSRQIVVKAVLLSVGVTAAGWATLAIYPLLGFLLLAPGVIIATAFGIGHAEGVLLAILGSWVTYLGLALWHFRRAKL
jgi:hypothetical protein